MIEKSAKMVAARLLLAAVTFLLVAPSPGRAENEARRETDVVVYVSSPAGIMSAIAAAQSGARVDLIEPLEHIGGVIANGGLCTTDLGDSRTVGGLAREFFDRILRYYVAAYGEKSPQVQGARTAGIAGACPEPHVAEQVFETWLKEYPRLRLHRNRRLETVRMQGTTIQGIVCVATEGPPAHDEFRGKVFIDASYTGDLLAKAAVSYRIGREGAGEYDESMAPKKADPRIMCYNFRMTLTNRAENRRSMEKPAHYDPARYRRYPSYAAAPAEAGSVFRTD